MVTPGAHWYRPIRSWRSCVSCVAMKAWTYGHALTAHRAQGSTAEESLLVLRGVAARSLARRQFYVANTRYRGAHRIYVSNRKDILARLEHPDFGRELATEFVERRRLTPAEFISHRRLPRMLENLRLAMLTTMQEWRRMRESVREHLEV